MFEPVLEMLIVSSPTVNEHLRNNDMVRAKSWCNARDIDWWAEWVGDR